jgi:DNA-binding GntR family transcriptional regulator
VDDASAGIRCWFAMRRRQEQFARPVWQVSEVLSPGCALATPASRLAHSTRHSYHEWNKCTRTAPRARRLVAMVDRPRVPQYATKEEQIADYLREEIISGRLARGTRLKQAELAAQLGASITPVREAFRMLKAEHYLSGESHQGMVVTPFSPHASEEIRDLRIMLEGKLIQESVRHIRSSDIDGMRELARQFSAAIYEPDTSIARGLNYRFHRRLFEVAHLPQTLRFVDALWARYPFDLINRIPGRVQHAAGEHEDLIKYLVAGDAAGAIEANRRHIEHGWDALNAAEEIEQQPHERGFRSDD